MHWKKSTNLLHELFFFTLCGVVLYNRSKSEVKKKNDCPYPTGKSRTSRTNEKYIFSIGSNTRNGTSISVGGIDPIKLL